MRNKKQYIYASLAFLFMLIIILDGKTALQGGYDGLNLCLRTAIPSLFPFFILSGIISSTIIGQDILALRPFSRICKIPRGTEPILLLGFLSGYPVGAQLATQSYKDGKISLQTAERMIAICNHAGPAFIFGMIAPMFSASKSAWMLWLIQILCGLLVGIIIPCGQVSFCNLDKKEPLTANQAMKRAIITMGTICGWIIFFRVILNFCTKWFLWRVPVTLQVLFSGLLELSNGCTRLSEIPNDGLRFILANVLLSAGGLCVTMQTISVSQDVFSGKYFLGKGMQAVFSTLLSLLVQRLLFADSMCYHVPVFVTILLCLAAILLVFLSKKKKYVAISGKMVYNIRSK